MRVINSIIIHCSASDTPSQDSAQAIYKLHTSSKKKLFKWGKYDTTGKNFNDIGYHYVITKDGFLHMGRPISKPGAHCRGYNHYSIGICLTGDTHFTQEQFDTLEKLLINLMDIFELTLVDIKPHSALNKSKTCPNFSLQEKLRRIYGEAN